MVVCSLDSGAGAPTALCPASPGPVREISQIHSPTHLLFSMVLLSEVPFSSLYTFHVLFISRGSAPASQPPGRWFSTLGVHWITRGALKTGSGRVPWPCPRVCSEAQALQLSKLLGVSNAQRRPGNIA